jgi:hypothetical protein
MISSLIRKVSCVVQVVWMIPEELIKRVSQAQFPITLCLLGGFVNTFAQETTPSALLVRSEDGRAGALVLTNGMQVRQDQDQTKLVFHRYGAQYFLAQVWTA